MFFSSHLFPPAAVRSGSWVNAVPGCHYAVCVANMDLRFASKKSHGRLRSVWLGFCFGASVRLSPGSYTCAQQKCRHNFQINPTFQKNSAVRPPTSSACVLGAGHGPSRPPLEPQPSQPSRCVRHPSSLAQQRFIMCYPSQPASCHSCSPARPTLMGIRNYSAILISGERCEGGRKERQKILHLPPHRARHKSWGQVKCRSRCMCEAARAMPGPRCPACRPSRMHLRFCASLVGPPRLRCGKSLRCQFALHAHSRHRECRRRDPFAQRPPRRFLRGPHSPAACPDHHACAAAAPLQTARPEVAWRWDHEDS